MTRESHKAYYRRVGGYAAAARIAAEARDRGGLWTSPLRVDVNATMQDYPCRSCGTRTTLNHAGLCAPCATAQAEWGR
jgi:hypothetical protein